MLLSLQAAARVKRLEREQVDVGSGLAAAFGDARVVAEDAVFGAERREEGLEVARLELEVGAVGGGGEGELDFA